VSAAGVGVVIPVRDGERYLAEAIDSALAQSHPPLDVVVVDDGSIDTSHAIAESYAPRVRCISQEAAGIGAARNAGAALLDSDYIALLDADDRWPRRRLEHQLAAREADPSVDLVFGHLQEFISPDLPAAEAATLHCSTEPRAAYVAGSVLIRRAAWERVGGFETQTHVAEFLEWLLRARELGCREMLVEDVVIERRIHRTNNTRVNHHEMREYAQMLKASLDRRRRATAG
jgi:glycosyltransferase involved in cell wall biosynthesis